MSRLRVGILGTGGIAARHAGAVAAVGEKLQLVACCGRTASRAKEFAANLNITSYVDFEQMLQEQRLDLLIVTLPPYAHDGQVEKAAAAGIHLLVEKPVALTMDRALSMVSAV